MTDALTLQYLRLREEGRIEVHGEKEETEALPLVSVLARNRAAVLSLRRMRTQEKETREPEEMNESKVKLAIEGFTAERKAAGRVRVECERRAAGKPCGASWEFDTRETDLELAAQKAEGHTIHLKEHAENHARPRAK